LDGGAAARRRGLRDLGRAMSIYQLNKLCHRTLGDLEFRAEMKRDPSTATSGFKFTEEEHTALLAGDVARLFEMGVHPFLLSFLTRYELFGLTTEVYSERIRKARDPWPASGDPGQPRS
jgi:hypothetical protein